MPAYDKRTEKERYSHLKKTFKDLEVGQCFILPRQSNKYSEYMLCSHKYVAEDNSQAVEYYLVDLFGGELMSVDEISPDSLVVVVKLFR